jgi:hypothetical protein
MVDQIVEHQHNYSLIESRQYGYVSKRMLIDRAGELKAAKKSLGLPGKKREKETRYFFNNARVLARISKEGQIELKDDVVAVLFRDSDGTISAGRGESKWKSMRDGFSQESFPKGVPMIPMPTSEAWLICALKNTTTNSAQSNYSGIKQSDALKKELEDLIGQAVSRVMLCEFVANRNIDIEKIDTDCFARFRKRLEEVI